MSVHMGSKLVMKSSKIVPNIFKIGSKKFKVGSKFFRIGPKTVNKEKSKKFLKILRKFQRTKQQEFRELKVNV